MTSKSRLIKYLKTQSKEINRLAPRVSQSFGGEPVHQLRVATRRVRAVCWVLRLSSAQVRIKKVSYRLRKLGKALGHVRELDVAILDANHYGIDSSELLTRRKLSRIKLRKMIKRDQRNNLAKLLSSLESAALEMSPALLNKARYNLRRLLKKRLKRRIHGQIMLHELRVTLKKIRYALEAMGRPATPIKYLQDILGEVHDLETLLKLTGKNEKIKKEQRALSDEALLLMKPALRFALEHLGDE